MLAQKRTTNPFDLPEIRTRIASFLSNKDCISCMRVSKDWSIDFARPIWHTIDFDKGLSFLKDKPTLVSKYGHLIRSVVSVVKEEHMAPLQNPSIASLRELQFHVTNNRLTFAQFTDLVRRNRETLTTLHISAHLIATITFEDQRQSGVYVSAYDLVLGSSLVSLSLSGLCITRDTFSAILQSSPSLLHLSLSRVMVLANNPMLVHFQHESIKTLSATFAQVWTHDDSFDESPTSPSLLIHFPCLQAWSVLDTSPTTYPVPIEKLRTELLDNCPRMKRVQFSTSDHGCLSDFLNNGFERLESCTFGYTCLDSITLLGLLQHQETLTSIALTLSIAVSDLSKPDPNPAAKSLIGLLARSCRRLEILSIEGHHMDVASMERHEWVCIDLKELRVRFQGLDSIGLINGCLDRLSARKSKGEGLVEASDEGGDSVGKRVCRQLLRFKKLRTVWLGTRDYYLATQ